MYEWFQLHASFSPSPKLIYTTTETNPPKTKKALHLDKQYWKFVWESWFLYALLNPEYCFVSCTFHRLFCGQVYKWESSKCQDFFLFLRFQISLIIKNTKIKKNKKIQISLKPFVFIQVTFLSLSSSVLMMPKSPYP